jgi:2-(3-amino-3-carboxypropyl)histidine synthase
MHELRVLRRVGTHTAERWQTVVATSPPFLSEGNMDASGDIEGFALPAPSDLKRPARSARPARSNRVNRIPESITADSELNAAVASLPVNYNFEIHKTVWKVREQVAAKALTASAAAAEKLRVALQFPEGLLMYSCIISDILERFAGCECIILGDVTYGACCVDDLTARALGCELLVHYGHSCLVPVSTTCVKCLYIFVEIAIDVDHLCGCIQQTFTPDSSVAIMGTIQFAGAVHEARSRLSSHLSQAIVPQAKPLSPGEVLGCTSPMIEGMAALVFVADGRFHLESAMIQNPHMQHLRYDPYSKVLTTEQYDAAKMHQLRRRAIDSAQTATTFGVILGTLGRQGNPHILDHLLEMLTKHNIQYFVLLLSEITPAKLEAMSNVTAWIQVACPRLSIDWGHFFHVPVLSPYEAEVCFGETEWKAIYPMDFYSKGSGPWTNQFHQQ